MKYRMTYKIAFLMCWIVSWFLIAPFGIQARDIHDLPLEDRISLALVNTYYQKEQYTLDSISKMKETETVFKHKKAKIYAYSFEKKYGEFTADCYYRIDDAARHQGEERPGWRFLFTDKKKKITIYSQFVNKGVNKSYLEVEMLRTSEPWTLTVKWQFPLPLFDVAQSKRKKDEVLNLIQKHGDRLYEYAKAYKVIAFLNLQLVKQDVRTFFLAKAWMDSNPLVKFRLDGLDRVSKLRRNNLFHKLQVIFELEMIYKGASGESYTTVENAFLHPMQHHPKKSGDFKSLEFGLTLHDFIKYISAEKEPFSFLALTHFDPEHAGSIPLESLLEFKIKPREIIVPVEDKNGRFRDRTINISDLDPSKALFRFGWKINMADDTKLKAGKSQPVGWQYYAGHGITVGKWLVEEGTEKVLTVIESAVNVSEGKYLDALINISECTPIEWLWWFKSVGESYVDMVIPKAPDTLLGKIEKGLSRLGYVPLDKGKSTKKIPLWINVETEKLVLLDPIGIVHQVINPPKNFHVAFPHYKLTKAVPRGGHFQVHNPDLDGNMPASGLLINLPHNMNRIITPPPLHKKPVIITLADPNPGNPSAEILHINALNNGGKLEFGAVKSPHGITYITAGMLAFGWEDDPDVLIFKKPYITLLQGKLKICNEKARIGVSYYKQGTSGKEVPIDVKVGAWLYPVGTVYTVQKRIESGSFELAVDSGSVEVRDAEGKVIDVVKAGEQKEIIFAPEAVSAPAPQPSDISSQKEQGTEVEPDGWNIHLDYEKKSPKPSSSGKDSLKKNDTEYEEVL